MTTAGGIKRIPNPPRTCIFCGGRPISKEHLYAAWMAEFLRPGGHTDHHVSTFIPTRDGELQVLRSGEGPMALKGEHRNRGLKVVCVKCNSGWMSRMQGEAKPALLPYLQGRPYLPNRSQQRAIANWAVMFSMIWERADPPTAAIDQRQRSHFMKMSKPPRMWLAWIAGFKGIGSGPAWHRGLGVIAHVEAPIPDHMNTQITLGGVGEFFFMTVSTTEEWVAERHFPNLRDKAAELGLFRVWPSTGFQQPFPKHVQFADFEYVFESMTAVVIEGIPGIRGGDGN